MFIIIRQSIFVILFVIIIGLFCEENANDNSNLSKYKRDANTAAADSAVNHVSQKHTGSNNYKILI